jgi:signal transduction histidine kinase/CheY-like chemotaxis protein
MRPVRLANVLRRHTRAAIVVVTIAVLVLVGALLAGDLWWRRERAILAAERRAEHEAGMLGEYLRGSVSAADAALRQLVVHGQRMGGSTGSHDDWDPMLAAARAALPESGSITVTDASGRITHSTQKSFVGQSRGDTYVFQQIAAGADGLVVDRPLLTAVEPKQYIIPVGRRLTTPDGAFDGAVVANLRPEQYREFFRTLDVGNSGAITVLHPDGIVIFREPSRSNPINERAPDDPVLKGARQSRAGVLHVPLAATGRPGIVSFRRLDYPPLIAAVSLDVGDVLREWYGQRRVSAIAYGVLTIALGGLVIALLRVLEERERAERDLVRVQGEEAGRLRDANDRLADALNREQQARKETETASYMKDEFLMTVSHELRTPLTAIYGWVRVLTGREMSKPEQARALAAIERNAVAQTRLIEDLLDVSRAISGKLRLEPRSIDVAAVIRAAADSVSAALSAKGIVLELSIDETIGPITADPDRLQQVVWNLLSNAIKFTPEGGRVWLTLAKTDTGQIDIVVRDTGAGIAPDFLPFVFERFRQGDAGSRRRYGGLGLGLAIVRHIVELHGGSVAAESEGEGEGSTFRVRLPVRKEAPRPATCAPDAAQLGAIVPVARLDDVRIVVVDDERDSLELFGEILEAAGARVRLARSAGDALRLLVEEEADVLLSDIEMPQVDGYELLRLVLADRRIARSGLVPIALTAYARASDRRRAFDAGFREHIAKPVDPVALVSTIAALLPVNRNGARTY